MHWFWDKVKIKAQTSEGIINIWRRGQITADEKYAVVFWVMNPETDTVAITLVIDVETGETIKTFTVADDAKKYVEEELYES
jgi:hypothetical protein